MNFLVYKGFKFSLGRLKEKKIIDGYLYLGLEYVFGNDWILIVLIIILECL